MKPTEQMITFQPKRVPVNFYLTKAAVQAATEYELNKKTVILKVDTDHPYAMVREFPLTTHAAKKLGRKENVVEGIACRISDQESVSAVRDYLTEFKVPTNIRDQSIFFFIRVGRRDYEDKAAALMLTKQHKLAKTESFVLGITNEDKHWVISAIFLDKRKNFNGAITVSNFLKTDLAEESKYDGQPSEFTSYPDNPTQDFAVCYFECVKNVPGWLVGVVAAICGACTGAIAASLIPGAQPVSVPILTAACGGCAVAIGVTLGNCFLTCHEMLEE